MRRGVGAFGKRVVRCLLPLHPNSHPSVLYSIILNYWEILFYNMFLPFSASFLAFDVERTHS